MCTPGKLNRSSSESDLHKPIFDFDNHPNPDGSFRSFGYIETSPFVTKRVLFIEQIFHGGSQRLLRSASCNLVVGSPGCPYNADIFNGSLLYEALSNTGDKSVVNLGTQRKSNISKNSTKYVDNDNSEITPMEIDIRNDVKMEDCVDFVEPMDVDERENYRSLRYRDLESVLKKRSVYQELKKHNAPELPSVKRELENQTSMAPIIMRQRKKCSQFNSIILALIFVLILLYILLIHGDTIYVNSHIQLQNIHKDLLEEVYEQKDSVNIVVRSLEQRNRWTSKIKVLGFIGPSGVGKTFVANIIKKHFDMRLIHELYGLQINYKSQWDRILKGLRSCCLNLIIIDDLKRKDATDVFALVHSLPPDQFSLVISIFNIQYPDDKLNYTIKYEDITDIRNEFDNSGLYNELIIFPEFRIEQVKDWIDNQLKYQNIDCGIKETVLNNILEGHNVKYKGLKGIYSKLLLELEKFNN